MSDNASTKNIEIKICMGTGGIAAGGDKVMESFLSGLESAGIPANVQMGCAAHQVGCRGLCAKDVLVDVIIDEDKSTYEYIKEDMVERLIEDHIKGGTPIEDWLVKEDYHNFHDKQVKVVLADCGTIDPESIDAYKGVEGYKALEKVLKTLSTTETIDIVKDSGLRGRGGAGFPTGFKWELCAKNEADQKYIICNADEGDPGAFMDRSVIEGNPHLVIEGMIIGAYSIGASIGYVYIRAEYPLAVERLRKALDDARNNNFLGKDILGSGFDFDIKVKLGAGAFVCGEETALIASIEGERGMPRAKPPFPVNSGLWEMPTVINNVETFANIPFIIRKGAEWFAAYGTEKSKGTKVFALTGKVKNSGLIEIPMGTTLRTIIFDIGGGIENDKKFKAVQTGGPSGGCLTEDMLDLNVDFESLAKVGSIIGSGGMIVLDEDNCMVDVAKYFLEFTQSESCGKCVPCRVGTKRLLEILVKITEGKGTQQDLVNLEKLAKDVQSSSLCGLGMTAPNPILSTLKYFRDEYEAHLDGRCPAKACRQLLTYTIITDACTGCGACKRACPASAIEGEKKQLHVLSQELCVKCGACFDTCKFNAIGRE
jgi:NADH-quinone oxidoreductase subunit F